MSRRPYFRDEAFRDEAFPGEVGSSGASTLSQRGKDFLRAAGAAPPATAKPAPARPAPPVPRRGPRPSNPGAVVQTDALPRPQRPRMAGAAVAGLGSTTTERGPEPALLDGGVLPFRPTAFRRTAVKPRRRRRSLWLRLVRPVATAVLLVSVPAAVAWWVLTSPRFELAEVTVSGQTQVPASWVHDRLQPMLGANLVLLPLAGVEESLADHPWIASVSIQKRLPDGLTIEVEERRAAVLVTGPDGEPWLADAEGHTIEPAPPGAEDELVRVIRAVERGEAAGPLSDCVPGAVEVAAALARRQPVWAAGLERIEALGQDDYRLHTRALDFPLLVRRDAVEERVERLERALPYLSRRLGDDMGRVAAVDLRFAGRLVLRATAEVPGGEGPVGGTPRGAGDRLAANDLRDVTSMGAMTDAAGSSGGGDPRRKVG